MQMRSPLHCASLLHPSSVPLAPASSPQAAAASAQPSAAMYKLHRPFTKLFASRMPPIVTVRSAAPGVVWRAHETADLYAPLRCRPTSPSPMGRSALSSALHLLAR